MTQVLFIDKDESLRITLKLNATKKLGVEAIEKESCAEAISLMQLLPSIRLVFFKESTPQSNELINFLLAENYNTTLLWMGEKKPAYPRLKMIAPDAKWESIIDTIGETLGINQIKADEEEGFQPIDCHYFFHINSTSFGCDVYIKIKKEGKDHYIKCLNSNDRFTKADIDKYMNQGLKEFHIPRSHFSSFVNFLTNKMVEKLEAPLLKSEEKVTVAANAYDLSIERIQSIGVDEFTIGIVESTVKSIMSSVNDTNALGRFLKQMKDNPLSYGYANAYMCSLILHKVIGHFEWATPQIKEKITHVAYFHNISLKNDELMKIKSNLELEKAKLSRADQQLVMNHALHSAQLVETFPSLPEGISQIIREHHGSKGGIGFPEPMSNPILPLSMMFIVVEDFVDEFLKIPGNPTNADMEGIFVKLNQRYTKSTYAQTVEALSKMVLKKG